MDPPLELSGSFGELRSVNFHTGIDIRVINRPQRRVYSVQNGYVSRIKVEPSGYGNTLYITHPNGYVSVYAHLDNYSGKISELVKEIQYKNKSFEIDVILSPDSLFVEKGEVIGIAGNTGFSFGPHLHFEIRDELTQDIIDPLLFGIDVRDIKPPTFISVKIYPHGNSLINGSNNEVVVSCRKTESNNYTLPETFEVSGAVSFGFETNDRQNNTNPNRLGLRAMKIFVDDSIFAALVSERLSFQTRRHLLAYIDFNESQIFKKRYQRSYRMKGNKSSIYNILSNDGVLLLAQKGIYNIRCIITDIGGNTAELNFELNFIELPNNFSTEIQCDSNSIPLLQSDSNVVTGEHYKIVFPEGSLFDDLCFSFSEEYFDLSPFAFMAKIHNNDVPLASWYSIHIKPDSIPPAPHKIVLANINAQNKLSALETIFVDSVYIAQARQFGNFVLVVDSLPPKITPVNIPTSEVITNLSQLRFTITDELSGIKSYDGYINGEWILFEYDLKNNLLFHKIDDRIPIGDSQLELIVTDKVENKSVFVKKLITLK